MSAHPSGSVPIGQIDHVAFAARDLPGMIAFLERVLGAHNCYEPFKIDGRIAVQQIVVGQAMLSVHQLGNGIELAAKAVAPGSLDVCFRWNAPIDDAIEHLKTCGVEIEEGPAARRNSQGMAGRSVYFRDPEGNLYELLSTEG